MKRLLQARSEPETEAPVHLKGHSSQLSLVLCPNVMLCEQVVRMANCLRGDNGEPLLKAAAVCGKQVIPMWSCLSVCAFHKHLCWCLMLFEIACLTKWVVGFPFMQWGLLYWIGHNVIILSCEKYSFRDGPIKNQTLLSQHLLLF